MTTFSEFVPMDRRAALAGDYSLPDRTSGAALFVDISGFTPLTAALAEELGADRGAEAVTDQLSRVFDVLIAQVHAYSGSVIGFSGDAVTCWFGEDDGRRATTAALGMQSMINELAQAGIPGSEAASIGIKVAVAAGPARRFLVGDDAAAYVEVLAGDTLDQTAVGERLANQGEVVVNSAVRDALDEDLTVLTKRSGSEGQLFYVVRDLQKPADAAAWPLSSSLPDDVTRRWILPAVFRRLKLGKGEFVSELRQATAMFLHFGGIDYDGDDESGTKLDAFVRWVQSVLKRYGASLIQVTLGEKGSFLFMVFGAPVAHEDDTSRALSAALDFLSPPERLDFLNDIRIGVNRGLIHAGTYGGAGSLTYGVLGDATNIAARLMGEAQPGQVLTPARLAASHEKDFVFMDLGQLKMKGLAGPMFVASLERRRTRGERTAAAGTMAKDEVIGRSSESAVVDECLEALGDGEKRILIIEGEAGIGKSHMIADLQTRAQRSGFETLEGTGDAIEQSSPYHAWRRIVRAAFDLEPAAESSGATVNDAVLSRLQTIDPDLVRLAPLLETVLAVDFPENELTQAMSGEVRAENLNRLLATVLAWQAATTPQVIVLDDAQWLDSASWGLARVVAREVLPLLLVIAARPFTAPSAEFNYLRQAPQTRLLTLGLLSDDDIQALIKQHLGVNYLPAAVASLIRDKAEGHPFFSEELAFALRDAGHIRVENGRAEMVTPADELQRLSFPDTIQGVITSRIDQVTEKQQLTLKVASVIGRVFAFQVLSGVYPVESSDWELNSELVELEQLDITLLETPDPELVYLFRHIILQEVTYGLLTFAQRKRLHRATAEWYEQSQADDLELVYPLLAYHWSVAEVAEKSVDYSLQAGKLALENGAFHEAVKHLSDGLNENEAAQVISDAAELAEWYYLKGEAQRSVGQLEPAMASLMTALELLGRPYPEGQARLTAGLLGQIGRQIAHRIRPSSFDGRAALEEYPLQIAQIYEAIQAIVFYQNQTIAAVYCIVRHLNLAEEAPPSPQRARSYAAMVNAVGVAGLHKQADTYLALAQESVIEDELIRDQDIVYQYLAIYFAGAGRWQENEEHALRAARLAAEIGNRRRWQENSSCLALALYYRGEIARSSQLRRQVLDDAVKEDDSQVRVWGLAELAELALLRGNPAEAAALLEQAEGIGGDLGLTEAIWLYGLLGAARLRLGDVAAAQTAVDRAQEAISAAPPSAFYLLEPISGMAEVNVALWSDSPEDSELRKRAQRTVNLFKQFSRSYPINKPRSLLWEGVFAANDGQQDKAVKIWLRGLESARNLGMPYDEGLLILELGAHTDDGPLRAQYLDNAREIFLELGAAHDLQRLDELTP